MAVIINKIPSADDPLASDQFLGRGKLNVDAAVGIVLAVAAVLYGLSYFDEYKENGLGAMGLFMNLFIASMNVLVVTHDMDLVAECCDFAVVLEKGAVMLCSFRSGRRCISELRDSAAMARCPLPSTPLDVVLPPERSRA